MKILIAEDDPISRKLFEVLCGSWGYDVVAVGDGRKACAVLEQADAPPLVILDWMMPGMDGLEVLRCVRAKGSAKFVYIILLTARGTQEDILRGLLAEADDYVTKPFDQQELRARVCAGERMVRLQMTMAGQVEALEKALQRVKKLQGLLPICSYCKRIRDDENYWQQVEAYIADHSEAQFTHGVCPQCYESIVKPEIEHLRA